MSLPRIVCGFAALFLLAAGLNVLVLSQTPFIAAVYVPLLLSAVLGAVWLVLRIVTLTRRGEAAAMGGLNSVVSALLFLGICVTIYAFARRWDPSWDLTQEGRRSLSPQTLRVLESLDEDVEVVCFFVHGGDARVDLVQDKTRRFLERAQRHTDHLTVEFVDPQRSPERLKAMNVLRTTGVGTVVLRAGTQQRELPLSDVTSRLEERDFTNALLNVSRENRPKVYFLTGHGERDILDQSRQTGSSDFAAWLRKEAYEVERHLIAYTDPKIPEDCAVLVINGFQSEFHPHEIEALDEYVSRGGRLLVLVNPSQKLETAAPSVEQFRPWIERRFGLLLPEDILASPAMGNEGLTAMFIPDFSIPALAAFTEGSGRSEDFRGSFNAGHPITRGFEFQMLWPGVRTVRFAETKPEDVTRTTLLQSTPDTWAERDLKALQEERKLVLEPDEDRGPLPVAAAATVRTGEGAEDGAGQEARLVLIGHADMTKNESIAVVAHHNFLLNAMAWLTESEELIAIRPTGEEDPPMVLSKRERQVVAWIASLGTSQAVLLGGIAAYLWRRKHQ